MKPKLTLVSIVVQRRRISAFVNLVPDENGKVRCDQEQLISQLGIDIPRGTTISQ